MNTYEYPLYKVYMGLILKGTIPRGPHHFPYVSRNLAIGHKPSTTACWMWIGSFFGCEPAYQPAVQHSCLRSPIMNHESCWAFSYLTKFGGPGVEKLSDSQIKDQGSRILPGSLTASFPLKISHPKRKFIFQPSFFRGYVKLRGCTCLVEELWYSNQASNEIYLIHQLKWPPSWPIVQLAYEELVVYSNLFRTLLDKIITTSAEVTLNSGLVREFSPKCP